MMPQVEQTRMSESQKSSLQEITSKYDPENFSRTSFRSMEEELRSSGIGRTSEVKSMLENAGFNINQYAKGGPGGMQKAGGPPPKREGGNVQSLQAFQEILDNYDLTNMSSEDGKDLMNNLTSSGLLRSGLIFDFDA